MSPCRSYSATLASAASLDSSSPTYSHTATCLPSHWRVKSPHPFSAVFFTVSLGQRAASHARSRQAAGSHAQPSWHSKVNGPIEQA